MMKMLGISAQLDRANSTAELKRLLFKLGIKSASDQRWILSELSNFGAPDTLIVSPSVYDAYLKEFGNKAK